MRLCRTVLVVLFFFGFQNIRTYGQVVATWTDANGNWSNAANWSTNPAVPNNAGGATYDVVINTPKTVVTMNILNDSVNNLTLGSRSALLISAGDSLNLVSGTSVSNGTLTNFGNAKQFGDVK
jgi:hypothetical protein